MRTYKDFKEFSRLTLFELGDAIVLRINNEEHRAIITAEAGETVTFGSKSFKFKDLSDAEYLDPKSSTWKHFVTSAPNEETFKFELRKTYLDDDRYLAVTAKYESNGKKFVIFNNAEVARAYTGGTTEYARLASGRVVSAFQISPVYPETFSPNTSYWMKDSSGFSAGTFMVRARTTDKGEDFVTGNVSTGPLNYTVDQIKINTSEFNESFRYGQFFCSARFKIEG